MAKKKNVNRAKSANIENDTKEEVVKKTNSKVVVEDDDYEEDIDEIEETEEEEEEVVVKKKKPVREEYDDDDLDDYRELTTEERIVNIDRKINAVIVLACVCIVVSLITLFIAISGGVSTKSDTEDTTSTESSSYTYDTSEFKEISATDIKSESSNTTIVVMVGRQGCTYCSQYAPTITDVAEDYGITVRYIDLSKILQVNDDNTVSIIDEESYEILTTLEGEGDYEDFASENFGYTPETIIIKNNKIIGGFAGNAESSSIEEAFEAAGFTK